MDQSKHQFLAETEDLIEQIFVDFDELRESLSENARRQIVDRLFRRIHRIKGSAASFDFEGLSEVAHEFENLLSDVRAGRVPLDGELLDAFESAAGVLAEALHVGASGPLEPSHREILDRMQTISKQVNSRASRDVDAVLNVIPFQLGQSLTSEEKHQLMQAVAKRNHLFVVTASFDLADFDDQFRNLKKALEDSGEVIATLPIAGAERSAQIYFQLLFASQAAIEAAKVHLMVFPVDITEIDCTGISTTPASRTAGSTAGASRLEVSSSLTRSIRVDVDELDRLISATHELFRSTTKALDLALSHPEIEHQVQRELSRWDKQVRRSFLKVEKELIDLRMVPLGPILQRTARAGRTAARLSGKKINFSISGENVRLDRVLRDAIADPLVQLVRNAVDHGIGTTDSGENSNATIRIEAYQEGKQTCLRVTDNGRGVNPELVHDTAIKLGIIVGDLPLDMTRCLRLLFRPGFTTLPAASTVSGRGVGLDVVETAVEQVGGEVRVSSEPGKGAMFEIRLPVTVGLVDSIVVLARGNVYCIDAEQTIQAETIDAREIESSESGKAVKTAAEIMPVYRLSALLNDEEVGPATASVIPIIKCEIPNGIADHEKNRPKRVGLMVDEILGPEEVLVRNLGRHAARWTGVAGATELRDGRVALVLDLPRLLEAYQ